MTRPSALPADQVAAALGTLPRWSGGPDGIERTFTRIDFRRAADMLRELAAVTEQLDHHPDVDVRWQTLRIFLVTHSAGGVTELDLEFARRVDELFDLPSPENRSPEPGAPAP
jgi:4a-hydroxytetrahydrobiopterin dehydratase